MITKYCYDGVPYSKPPEETSSSSSSKPKKASTYSKVKSMYERSLAEMAESAEFLENFKRMRRRWNGTFFDTKVEQQVLYSNKQMQLFHQGTGI